MRRRTFLATTGALLLAPLSGCVDANGSLALRAIDRDSDLTDQYAVSIDRASGDERDAVVAAIDGENATHTTSGRPFESARAVEYRDAFYEIDHEVVDEETRTAYFLEVDYDPGEYTPELGAIDYEDLPESDREALSGLLDERDHAPTDNEGFDVGRSHVYPADAESVLVPDPEYDVVRVDGDPVRVRVEGSEEVTFRTFRYESTEVATDAATMAARVRERYRFDLTGLSDAERELVDGAIEETHYVENDPSDAFRSLVERLRGHDAVEETEYRGEWLATYDGTEYWISVEFPYELQTERAPESPPATPPESGPE